MPCTYGTMCLLKMGGSMCIGDKGFIMYFNVPINASSNHHIIIIIIYLVHAHGGRTQEIQRNLPVILSYFIAKIIHNLLVFGMHFIKIEDFFRIKYSHENQKQVKSSSPRLKQNFACYVYVCLSVQIYFKNGAKLKYLLQVPSIVIYSKIN